jgi:hypothetical protein
VERLTGNEFLGDLPFEFDAMGTILCHGFHPLKARQSRSIPNLQDVHRQGRTPARSELLIRRLSSLWSCHDAGPPLILWPVALASYLRDAA